MGCSSWPASVGQWGVGLMSLAVASISLFIVRGVPVVYVGRVTDSEVLQLQRPLVASPSILLIIP